MTGKSASLLVVSTVLFPSPPQLLIPVIHLVWSLDPWLLLAVVWSKNSRPRIVSITGLLGSWGYRRSEFFSLHPALRWFSNPVVEPTKFSLEIAMEG